jgi:type VI secretion system secreted protein VgrG
VPYAPPRRTPKPVVRGSHTALVVSNEDPDGHARVQVRFPWAPAVSFWARVVQGWAGAGWGAQFHPRPGHEVVVEFLEGDPDQPIVTGRVYNGANPGPYSDNMKLGGIKTRSYDGGAEEFNELRFDDTPGEEDILLHAQKNWTVEVENDEGKSIGANRSETVADNVTIEIGGDRNETVKGGRSLSVGGAKVESVSEGKTVSVDGELTETIGKKMSVDVGADRKLTVGGKLTEDVTKDASKSVGGAWTHSVTKAGNVDIGEDMSTKVGKNSKTVVEKAWGLEAKEVAVKAKDQISFECGKAKLTLKKNGDVVLEGGKISIKGSKDVVVKGSKIGEN